MARSYDVITPEHVAIRYELAGFGSRAVAALVDTLLILLAYLAEILLISLFTWLKFIPAWDQWKESLLIAVLGILLFATFWVYYVAFETCWSGATPGKRYMGLRVIMDGGHPVDFRAALTRNLLRVADVLPGIPALPSYALGFVVLLCNPHYKRLGDLAAGTLVVRHGHDDAPKRRRGFGEAVTYRLLDPTMMAQLTHLHREEYRMVQRFLERRATLTQPLRGEFARRLAEPLIEKFNYHPPERGMDYERWLEELDLAYRTRAIGGAVYLPPAPKAQPTGLQVKKTVEAYVPRDGRKW